MSAMPAFAVLPQEFFFVACIYPCMVGRPADVQSEGAMNSPRAQDNKGMVTRKQSVRVTCVPSLPEETLQRPYVHSASNKQGRVKTLRWRAF